MIDMRTDGRCALITGGSKGIGFAAATNFIRAGASVAILGTVLAVAGMVLAWPNPASIVPAALFNFALFTAVAVFLDEPTAHVIAAGCLTLAYVIAFQVLAGHVPWENLRVASLLRITESVSTGQALTTPFVSFVLVHEWLSKRRKASHAPTPMPIPQ